MACRSHELASTACSRHKLLSKWVGGTGTGSKYGAVYRDGSASVDPLHALVVDNSDEVWSVGGLDYLPSEGFGSNVVALDVELCRRWRSRWRSCGSMTAHVNTWPRWSTRGPLPRLHAARLASHKPHHNSRERALHGERSGGNRDESHRRAICQIAGWTMRCLMSPQDLRDDVERHASGQHHEAAECRGVCNRGGWQPSAWRRP
jgi:hypothetical protein